MTTTVTVTTHGRPAMVTLDAQYAFVGETQSGHGQNITHNFVEKNATATFTCSDTQVVTVEELAENATGLPGSEPKKEDPEHVE